MLYDEDPIIQEVTEDRIKMFFNGDEFIVNRGDTVSVFTDEHSGIPVTSMPKLEYVTFQELYDDIIDDSSFGEYGYSFLERFYNICGIGRDA